MLNNHKRCVKVGVLILDFEILNLRMLINSSAVNAAVARLPRFDDLIERLTDAHVEPNSWLLCCWGTAQSTIL